MIIKNKKEINTSELRKKSLKIIEEAINSVLPGVLIDKHLTYDPERKLLFIDRDKYDLSCGRVFVIGGGKAAGMMAEKIESLLGNDIKEGLVNCKSGEYKTKKIKVIKAGHPIPDKEGLKGVKSMLALKDKHSIGKNDLVVCLISGGGSSLMTCPAKELVLEDVQKTNELLISCGADIREINIVRKHLSQIKGGQLAKFFAPARIVSLIISDVVSGDLDSVASGPTVVDQSSFKDALLVLDNYTLKEKVSTNIVNFLEKAVEEKRTTPIKLKNTTNYVIGDNEIALNAAKKKAKELGFNPFIVSSSQEGETSRTAQLRAREIKQGKYKDYNFLLIGGETNPVLSEKHGNGGRNQHYLAVTLKELMNYDKKWLAASISTDGSDFSSVAAGAIIDNNSVNRVKEENIDIDPYLISYDSNSLFKKIGNSLIKTGNTGTNVGDIVIYII